MPVHSTNWMKPEEALSRFKKPKLQQQKKLEADSTSKSHRYGFMVANIGFLIAEKTLSEIVKNPKIYPIPNTRSWMRGLVNLRGNLVPVYDLSLMTGLTDKLSDASNLLVLGTENRAVGVVIEDIPRSIDVNGWAKVSKSPYGLNGLEDHVKEAYSNKDNIWLDFDEKSFFESVKETISI